MQDYLDDLLGEPYAFLKPLQSVIGCIGFGVLSFLPYPLLWYLTKSSPTTSNVIYDFTGGSPEAFLPIAFALGMLTGGPFGITGILFGLRFLAPKPRFGFSLIVTYFGCLLGILGVICHLMLFLFVTH